MTTEINESMNEISKFFNVENFIHNIFKNKTKQNKTKQKISFIDLS